MHGGIPDELLLACVYAESGGLNPRAQRWGYATRAALAAIERQDYWDLQAIIDVQWPDISFGYMQRIVLYHWAGNREPTVKNCLAVREAVFANPLKDLQEGARQLAWCLAQAQSADLTPVHGDVWLMALVIYNYGHRPTIDDTYWTRYALNVQNYKTALVTAREVYSGNQK